MLGFKARDPMLKPARLLVIGALLIGTGCATHPRATPGPSLASASALAPASTSATHQCLQWFDRLDAATAQAGVTDAEFDRIDGFPYLRINRHALALGQEAVTPRQQADWAWRLRALAQQARQTEIANLPATAIAGLLADTANQTQSAATPALSNDDSGQGLLAHAEACGNKLTGADVQAPPRLSTLRAAASVADRYALGLRALGLYPLSRLGVSAGVRRWEADTRARYRANAADGAEHANWPAFGRSDAPDPTDLTALLTNLPVDSLGVPQLSHTLKQQLLAAHAPVFLIEQQSPADAPGAVMLGSDGLAVVESDKPTLYQRVSFTRYRGRSLIQLVYTLWFPERPVAGAFDIYAGRLDGVVLRITLDRQGRPVIVDTIHPCGCYHQFFTAQGVTLRDRPLSVDARNEWRYLPGATLSPDPGQRLEVAIEAATHYVVGVRYASLTGTHTAGGQPLNALTPQPERSLTRLNSPHGGPSRSLYGSNGLVAGTERSERWILWPMGIASAGAMRQWGHHATAFVGQRHFDDARLMESRFVLP